MKLKTLFLTLFLSCTTLIAQPIIHVIPIHEAIGPSTADFVNKSVIQAEQKKASAIIITLDTPGGLDASMRDIIKTITTAQIPIITYVTPSGARAASAGTYMLYASHIAAMAPGTNLGAATPVNLIQTSKSEAQEPSAMETKVLNDATAYIKGLATLRNRNAQWAEKAVRQGDSINATTALSMNVISIMATSIDDLLEQCHNKTIVLHDNPIKLNTKMATIRYIEPSLRIKFLSKLTSPDIAYMLLIAGVYCLILEFSNPGLLLPGVSGLVCLILSFYGLNILPLNSFGIFLTGLGLLCLIIESFASTYGIMAIIGTGLFIAGSLFFIEPNPAGLHLSLSTIITMAITNLIIVLIILRLVISAHKLPKKTGSDDLIGKLAICESDFDHSGIIKVQGEIWKAETIAPVKKGEFVKIKALKGLTAIIESTERSI